MIGYLRGEIKYLFQNHCLLDVNGVGYRVMIGTNTCSRLVMNEEAELFIYTSVREDAIVLYGFLGRDEYELFQQLIMVSGIGPKVAMGILSSITVSDFCHAIQHKSLESLVHLPGIGKKSAERLFLELKDKINLLDGVGDIADGNDQIELAGSDNVREAAVALSALGYTDREIEPVLKKVKENFTVEETIKFALREFAGRK